MITATAISLRNRRDRHQADQLDELMFRTRGPKQRESCWSDIDKTAMLDTALRGFTCGPIYTIKDLDEGIEDVFDGAHRCEAIFDYIDSKYPITKGKKDTIKWGTSPLKGYEGKYFKDLLRESQDRLKKYTFTINEIDTETAQDPDALQMLWERLSKAGKPLNNYETKIQTHAILHKEILEPTTAEWIKSPLVQVEKSKRGQVEVKLNKLLALSEKEVLPNTASMEDLVSKWCEENLGKTVKEIDENTRNKKDIFIQRLKVMRSLLRIMEDRNVFVFSSEDTKKNKSSDVPLLIILGRIGFWIPSVSKFNHVAEEICKFVHDILELTPTKLCDLLKVNSRNAQYQHALRNHVDQKLKILSEKANERRLFTPAEKKKKLEEQGGCCTLCNESIHQHQRNHGDHIIEYCKGGDTKYENLQVVHKHCHETKGKSL